MMEVEDKSCALMVTSPPYFNAPFDYKDRYASYSDFLELMRDFAKETYRVLADGRIACVNCDDMLVDGEKYPVVADITKLFLEAGFRYRDKIIWRKPEGYIRISRRSGVMLQNPYPMYFYPDNLQESILIFQKGRFDYSKVDKEIKDKSKIDLNEFQKNKWFLSVWDMVNRLPFENKLYKNYPAAFPEELPYRLIKLFSYKDELVLDPFLGSGTTTKVCIQLERNSVGYEVDQSLEPLIRQKLGLDQPKLAFESPADVKFIHRERAPSQEKS
jgi:site-specific DNA-methyltransferase (adenine-specific)